MSAQGWHRRRHFLRFQPSRHQGHFRLLDSARSLDALDRIGEGIFALDADGRITYVNHAARRLLSPFIGANRDLIGTVI